MHDRFVSDNVISSRYLLFRVVVSLNSDDDMQAISAVMRCRGRSAD
jgi:hypothetical protein